MAAPAPATPRPTSAQPPSRPPPVRPPPRPAPSRPSSKALRQERLERVPVAPVTLNAFKRKRAIEMIQVHMTLTPTLAHDPHPNPSPNPNPSPDPNHNPNQAHIRGAHTRRRMRVRRRKVPTVHPARRPGGCFTRPFGCCGAVSAGGATSAAGGHAAAQAAPKCHMAAYSASPPRRRPQAQGGVCSPCSPRGVAPRTACGGTAATLSARPASSTPRPRVAAVAAAAAISPRPATAPHRPYPAQSPHAPIAYFLAGGGGGGTAGAPDAPAQRPSSARMPASQAPWLAHAPSGRPRTALGPAEHRARDDDRTSRGVRGGQQPSRRRAQSASAATRSGGGGGLLRATAASDVAPARARAALASP